MKPIEIILIAIVVILIIAVAIFQMINHNKLLYLLYFLLDPDEDTTMEEIKERIQHG
jgi:hypothetical protein